MQCIALLGRKDEPTDAVEEYCRYLGDALRIHGVQMDIRRVPWEIHGWDAALETFPLIAKQWAGMWVFVQYTALAWSSRGFPQKFLRVIEILKAAGVHVGIVFHDVEPYPGTRLVDRFRRYIQTRVMWRALTLSDLAIFTVPVEKVSWVSDSPASAAFVVVGPNLPIPEGGFPPHPVSQPTVGVFSITGGDAGAREARAILGAVREAATRIGSLRLSVFGRHAELREAELRQGLEGVPVSLSVEGVVEAEGVVRRLAECDVLLFVRGPISSRRSSAIAGIACGLPVIAYPGSETAAPITDAGVVLVPQDEPAQLNDALVRVLSDESLRRELRRRSSSAYADDFSWKAIAARYASLLKSRS